MGHNWILISTQMVMGESKHVEEAWDQHRKKGMQTHMDKHTHEYTQVHLNAMDTLLDTRQIICAFQH